MVQWQARQLGDDGVEVEHHVPCATTLLDIGRLAATGCATHQRQWHDARSQPLGMSSTTQRCVDAVAFSRSGKALISCGSLAMMMFAKGPEVARLQSQVGTILHRLDVVDVGRRHRTAEHRARWVVGEVILPRALPVAIVATFDRARTKGLALSLAFGTGSCVSVGTLWSVQRRSSGHAVLPQGVARSGAVARQRRARA